MDETKNTNEIDEEFKTEEELIETSDDLGLAIGIGTCVLTGIIGFMLGSKVGRIKTKKLVSLAEDAVRESMNDERNAHTKALLRQICPEIGTKYIVERFDDFSGRTIGKYHSNRNLIEKVAKETAEEVVKRINK